MSRRDKSTTGSDDTRRSKRRALGARHVAESRLSQWGDKRFWQWLKKAERKVSKAIAHLRRQRRSPEVSRLIAEQMERAQWFSLVREEAERLRPRPPGVPSDRTLRRRRVGLYAREKQIYRPPE